MVKNQTLTSAPWAVEMSAGYCALSMTGSSWIMTCTVCDPECQTSAYKRKQQLDRHTWP